MTPGYGQAKPWAQLCFLILLVVSSGPTSPTIISWLLPGSFQTPGLLSCAQGLAHSRCSVRVC